MEHRMSLRPIPFGMIKSGQKTVELRLFDEKRAAIRVGDTLRFCCTEGGEPLFARVITLHRFSSFSALYAALPLLKCGYTEEDIATAAPSDMDEYYSPEEQRLYGVVGIELCVI